MNKPRKHGSYKSEKKADKLAKALSKGDKTRNYFVKKRNIKTVSGGNKIRYMVQSEVK